ncbi:hypothetical protein V2J09_014450 [Rumex salicifolius]
MPAMEFVKSIHPKSLFRLKKSKSRHISISEPASFNTVDSSSSSSSSDAFDLKNQCSATPTSVLPTPLGRSRSEEIAPEDLWFELVEAFKLIDRDGDGKITKSELGMVLTRIGVATSMLAEIDLDRDGCISLEEFGAVRSAFAPVSGMEELRETFNVFDADHDGSISAEELLSVFSAIGDQRCTIDECRRMIECVDVNGDGFVCFEDFTRMMEQQQQLQLD